jgi:hypothetical protein
MKAALNAQGGFFFGAPGIGDNFGSIGIYGWNSFRISHFGFHISISQSNKLINTPFTFIPQP